MSACRRGRGFNPSHSDETHCSTMPCCCCAHFCSDVESVLDLCVVLVYLQILCSLVGSLVTELNGVLVVHLVLGLFALIAVYTCIPYLCRTYYTLLLGSVVLDILWLALYARWIWNIDLEKHEPVSVCLLRLALATQTIGFLVRIFSSLMWIQIFRLGLPKVKAADSNGADSDVREKLLDTANQDICSQESSLADNFSYSIRDTTYFSAESSLCKRPKAMSCELPEDTQ